MKEITTHDTTTKLIERLTNAHGASGFEGEVASIVYDQWRPLLEKIAYDNFGNIVGTFNNNSDGPKVLLMAHLDEVGLIVRDISPEGYIYFDELGGWAVNALPGQRWIISTSKGLVLGYTGIESGHVNPDFKQSSNLSARRLFIDIGAKSKEEVVNEFGIRPGLPITPDSKFTFLNNKDYLMGKAFDDRIGLALITDILNRLQGQNLPNKILVAATVQEEVGMRGAKVIYKSLKPDIVINIEISVATDFPLLGENSYKSQVALDKGPSITVYDGSMIANPNLVEWIINLAKNYAIPVQIETSAIYSEDASQLQIASKGLPVINLGVPTRYVHSHAGILSRSDYDKATELVSQILQHLTKEALHDINNKATSFVATIDKQGEALDGCSNKLQKDNNISPINTNLQQKNNIISDLAKEISLQNKSREKANNKLERSSNKLNDNGFAKKHRSITNGNQFGRIKASRKVLFFKNHHKSVKHAVLSNDAKPRSVSKLKIT